MADEDIPVGETALALALALMPGVHGDRYAQHLKKLSADTKTCFAALLKDSAEDTVTVRAAALRTTLHETHDYAGDETQYDDLQNGNLVRVIERRKGLPVALGLLYMSAARAQGWKIEGLNFPGHFLVRLEHNGQRVILDPFRQGQDMAAPDLRELLKTLIGHTAELDHNYYLSVTNRDVLLRLQNNLKTRMIEDGTYAEALRIIETMETIAPEEYRVLFDKAVLYVKLNQADKGIEALEKYIDLTPYAKEKHYAQLLLQEIRYTDTP